MQLVMGMSLDGYVSTREDDDMKWLGSDDKVVFKLLTLGAKYIFVSEKTSLILPELVGRNVVPLSRKQYGISLDDTLSWNDNSILIGGQTVAIEALKKNMISRAHICISDKMAPLSSKMQKQEILPYIQKGNLITKTRLQTCTVETWDL